MKRLAFVVVVALAAGCNPTLSAQSLAPPGRAARLACVDGIWGIKSYRHELSRGRALALTGHHRGPCQKLHVSSDDPSIAEVHDASFGVLQPNGGPAYAPLNQATATAFVVVGKSPGTTKLHVSTDDGGRTIAVTIAEPPGPR